MRPELLTSPQIPKPLHGVNPRTILGQVWWDYERQAAYKTKDYHCWACGIHKTEALYRQHLEAHEDYDINWKTGEVKLREIVALCHSCHNFVHSGRLLWLYKSGQIDRSQIECILHHGFSVCQWGGVTPFIGAYVTEGQVNGMSEGEALKFGREKGGWEPPAMIAAWEQWHLVIDDKIYPTPYKDINEWREKYGET